MRSGDWWVKETGNEILRIRCAVSIGTYDIALEKYKNANLPRDSLVFINKPVMLPMPGIFIPFY